MFQRKIMRILRLLMAVNFALSTILINIKKLINQEYQDFRLLLKSSE
ncbi:hypothetical protein FDUTEX481_01178 [Tolypothrix sp. PCC 7601]|nr:hypothetical protein FDUTEX481_01178 [Tolypothrix sp. PCC 7601]